MITLNIISPELKKEIKLKNTYQIMKRAFIMIGVFLFFYSIILISSKFVLQSYLDEIGQKNTDVNDATNKTIQMVDDINKKIDKVSTIQKKEIDWIGLLELISANTASEIKYNRMSMDKINGLTLSGESKTRDGLIKIKKFLDEATFLSDVNFPISNLLEKENINFNITAKIKNYEFK